MFLEDCLEIKRKESKPKDQGTYTVKILNDRFPKVELEILDSIKREYIELSYSDEGKREYSFISDLQDGKSKMIIRFPQRDQLEIPLV